MTPHVVVDIGNTRVKWGRCRDGAVVESAGHPHEAAAWEQQLGLWGLTGPLSWVVSSVHPPARDRLVDWARGRGDTVVILEDPRDLPLTVRLEHPEWVGIDRLLDAVAVNRRRKPGTPAVILDAGSAVTVDYLDEDGAFRGGAIVPGLRLMAQALHDHTALLPLIDVPAAPPPLPGSSTPDAMRAGIFWTVVGGIDMMVRRLAAAAGRRPEVYLTGGDSRVLHQALGGDVVLWPFMTLEGIRLSVEARP